ncbi:MAG: hypothetical protein K9K66_09355 [Desulfarculaceae bacterium]|nr:hypothetical protein [Desulfarculaceae bacterium]MCF8073061.1 hypothetical protein [Desulfarculaceae bacterium]MCF8101854.1 hypothetical protein [Desulfarculaceae bacterium]MCF8115381.1 hypothetical protein [Desulfarculaceae bacterium]
MASRAEVKVVGFRWLSSRPNSACEQCARLHNQEFYYQPKAGQRSVNDMPEPPLHPNCRCHTEPITVTTVELEAQDGKPSFIDGGSKALGGYWKNNGRGLLDGPVYQKWCGQYWSAGRDIRDSSARGAADPSPADDLDAACSGHDDCYELFDEDYCDRQLIENMQALSDDPHMWRNPPENAEDAKNFRKWATVWFKLRVFSRQLRPVVSPWYFPNAE